MAQRAIVERCDILVVGAGFGQLPAIQSARAMGLRVLAIDQDAGAPGMAIANETAPVDVVDIEGAIAVARTAQVRGVLTMQSDLPVPTVGAVNDALGLVGVSSHVAVTCSNKVLARERFHAAGIPQPDFRIASSCSEAEQACREIGYPCIIKAPDSSGSRGVVRVEALGEVNAAFKHAHEYSREGRVLIEGFIEGIEIGAQAFSVDGRCVAVHIHDDIVSDPPYMVPIGHSYPTLLASQHVAEASQTIASAVDALGISDGPSNVDVILKPDGTVELLEIGARIGATCLPELTSLHIGRDWVVAAITAAMGGKPELEPRQSMPVAAYILESPEDGVVEDWAMPKYVIDDDRLLDWEVTVQPGDAVSRLRKGTDRIGKAIATGEDVGEAIEVAKSARDAFSVAVLGPCRSD